MTGQIRTTRQLGDDGEWVLTPEYVIDGRVVTEAVFRVEFPEAAEPDARGVHLCTAIHGARPLRSDALACHTSQIPAIMARNAKHGLHVQYDRLGRPAFTDAGQRKAWMMIEGVRQMKSYYGT